MDRDFRCGIRSYNPFTACDGNSIKFGGACDQVKPNTIGFKHIREINMFEILYFYENFAIIAEIKRILCGSMYTDLRRVGP